ncbi:MAG TPA: holo-ACP synthase [Candidatus Deferrimicrobium sp.]|nr:holo-ACP synthase [Candidatus Deferrimicrobium sp.]
MVRSVGLDIVEIARIRRDITRFGDRFVNRVLGETERSLYDKRKDKDSFLAGRLAAKEAVVKGLGTFLDRRPPLRAIQVSSEAGGAPVLALPSDIQRSLIGVTCHLSITHERSFAAAVAVFEERR